MIPKEELERRLELLTQALKTIATPTPCSGGMTHDEQGQPYPAKMAEWHRRNCVRCIAREALDETAYSAEGKIS